MAGELVALLLATNSSRRIRLCSSCTPLFSNGVHLGTCVEVDASENRSNILRSTETQHEGAACCAIAFLSLGMFSSSCVPFETYIKMRHICRLFISLALVLTAAFCHAMNEDESLLAFKNQVGMNNTYLDSWKNGTDPCKDWFGVTCSGEKVTKLWIE